MGKITQILIYKTRNKIFWRRLLAVLTLIISTGLLVIFTNFLSSAVMNKSVQKPAFSRDFTWKVSKSEVLGAKAELIQKSHPLPLTLKNWQDKTNSSDYFDQITPTKVGYLIWSRFPVQVKIDKPTGMSEKQAQIWVNSILEAVQEWSVYLPLQVVEQPEADITIVRKAPPLQLSPQKIPRARSALTTFELYTTNNVLSHRFRILLSPSQAGEYVQASARHELGHALGIWGHSPLQTDVLYFSQVRNPPTISARDVNTLKRIYEQTTNLGW
ncbi:peptidase [Anabaena cylindrica FACHB-243]|uniref:Peptidase metallopeptidase n=1 Tax=Anabaena cylindrica (strain ATCC 27899 / PCC 7122) TaxID=272123 RepID=K9ZMH0_ANACC|nr:MULTISPECIES: peptidase [Anabaena]AFZ59525.1 peptidase metallopeptidase [Anabaena cylindrica PCC 7122]MBD2418810.1 peptidase [Anabaena cylindrica FACHB-243]MBY5283317.1 peptidase [Anabaena sp. CCAP 1446/1C]MBY5306793.1 peptidase [Anabaena sp. CCAP 1446/1C]MCM2406375.1 peptidase [Anabaena sp. CCAP 1446/1C]